VAIQYLLARFAWTIFAHSINFIQQGLKRTLCIYVGDGETSNKDFSGEQCRQLFISGPKSRSQSPRKRQRDALIAPPEEKEDNEEHVRGRRRRRSFSSSSRNSSFDEKLWATSQDTLPDPDTETESEDGTLNIRAGGERQPKRRCLVGPCGEPDTTSEFVVRV
jgi:hypothetical protein